MTKAELKEYVEIRLAEIKEALAKLADAEAAEIATLFPAWKVGVWYNIGDRVKYLEKLYKVIQAHTSQADWTPDIVPALYQEVTAE